jgi:WD40 repeat protein
VIGLKWSVDKKYLASGDANGTVLIWDNRAGRPLADTRATNKIGKEGGVKVSHMFYIPVLCLIHGFRLWPGARGSLSFLLLGPPDPQARYEFGTQHPSH